MKIGIALVSYNTTKNQIKNLSKCLINLQYEYMVVYDNSPTDCAKNLFINLGWEYHWNGKNLGFGKAHNFIFNNYGHLSNFHLIVNPDVSFDVNILKPLICFLNKTKDAGCVMPKILYPDGQNQYLAKYLPSLFDFFLRRIPVKFLKSYVDNKTQIKNLYNKKNPFKAPFLSACFLLFKNEKIQNIGFFDERFFLYAEDLDLTRRFWMANAFPYCYPEVIVYHDYTKASSKNIYLFFIHLISLIKYFYKWGLIDTERSLINHRCSTNK